MPAQDSAAYANPTIAAYVGDGADVTVSENVVLESRSILDADSDAKGISISGVAIGVSLAKAEVAPTVDTHIGQQSTVVAGHDITLHTLHQCHVGRAALDRGAAAFANASGGGALVGRGAVVDAVAHPQISTSVQNGATIQALGTSQDTGNVSITSESRPEASAEGTGKSGGLIGVGVIESDADVINRNSASIGEDVRITASQSFELVSDSSDTVDVRATGGSGGVVDISQAETSVSVDDQTTTEIGNRTVITAEESISVQAQMTTTADTDSEVDTGGLGANADTKATMTFLGATTTTVGGATLRANTVDVAASVTELDIGAGVEDPMADSHARGVGADSDASTTVTTTTTTLVTVRDGASITGLDEVDLVAKHENLVTKSVARAKTNGLGGDTDASATNSLTADTGVNSSAGAEITTKDLSVEARAPTAPIYLATAESDGAWIDWGDESLKPTLNMNRHIDFDSTVILPGASPRLEIAADGSVVEQNGVEFTEDESRVVIEDIRNTGELGGNVSFAIPESDYDSSSTVTSVITGEPTFELQTGFESVTITNHSDKDLHVSDIVVQNPSGQESQNITVSAGDQSQFSWTPEKTPGNTPIVIENTGAFEHRPERRDRQSLWHNPHRDCGRRYRGRFFIACGNDRADAQRPGWRHRDQRRSDSNRLGLAQRHRQERHLHRGSRRGSEAGLREFR